MVTIFCVFLRFPGGSESILKTADRNFCNLYNYNAISKKKEKKKVKLVRARMIKVVTSEPTPSTNLLFYTQNAWKNSFALLQICRTLKVTSTCNSILNNVGRQMAKLLCIASNEIESIGDEELSWRIREMRELCSATLTMETRARQTKALRGVSDILRNGTRTQLQLIGPRDIVFCLVKILFYFEDGLHGAEGGCDWKRRRDYRIARACYHDLLRSFVPEQSARVVRSLVEVVHGERLWHWEDLCWDLALGLLECGVGGAPIAHALLDRVEAESTGVRDARAIVRMLYEILDVYSWPKSEESVEAVERLLGLYRDSLSGGRADEPRPRVPLRKGLEVCVRHAIKHLANEHLLLVIRRMCSWSVDDETTDGTILDFGSTLEYAAYMHESRLYRDTFDEELFDVLMRMLSSNSRLVSLLGNRVIQYLIDRRGNRSQFDTPKIFFEGMQFDLKINECVKEDKYFLQRKREIFHDGILSSMINHCSTRLNLECTYCTVCLIAVEVPCGFTAAALVCLAMNFQDVTFERSDMRREASYHIHATVMAVMSLLCWIHEAKVFYSYVNKIMTERAQWAPHLNPPIKARYSFAVHHVLWDKPELFFVDWEARYGLWKCFRHRESQQRSREEDSKESRSSA